MNNPSDNWNTTKNLLVKNSPAPSMPDPNRQTALENLARRYRRFSIFGAICAPLSLMWLRMPSDFIFYFNGYNMNPWITVLFILYFSVCSLIDYRFYVMISEIDPASMPVAEVLRRALRCRKMHLYSIMCIAPVALFFISSIIYFGHGDSYFIAGILCGAILGLAIGLRQLTLFLKDYHDICR